MKFIYLATALFLSLCGISQTTNIYIGSGTQFNNNTEYPAPYGNWYWGAKHQIIVLASELSAAGMSAGDIYGLGFNVAQANGTQLDGFTIKIGTTTSTQFGFGSNFQTTGLTTVYGPSNYTESSGVNMHTFSTPFNWDGSSNLIIDVCFNNSSFTNNASTYYTQTSNNTVMYERQDAPNVCGSTGNGQRSDLRPNLIFEWQVPNIPPVADFVGSPTVSCSGDIQFIDQSTNAPTSWAWDFGDGGTSTQQNPTHTYTSTGTYTVSLTATNAFGSDDEIKTSYISVNLSGATPATPSCLPQTDDGSLGFGITNVEFNTINKTSGDASEGYSDFTCDQTTVYAGLSYTFNATHSSPTTHNCTAWIDWNNDGVFNNTTEKIASSSSANSTSATVVIPSNAVLNTMLRMRVIADYDLNAQPTPCLDPQYGQCEDYTVIVEQLALPPTTDFSSNVIYTCDGAVEFEDLSTNIPYAWAWNFGDGGTSVAKNPTHTYTSDGLYTVQLITTNQYGSDTLVQTNYIEVATEFDLIDASCEPSTLSYCCGYGIYTVSVNTINYSSGDAEDGYQDYSCQNNTIFQTGTSYLMEVRTGTQNPQDTKVWIDFDNNGTFDNSTELVFSKLNAYNPTAMISIPTTGITTDTYLRMRVSSDEVGATLNPCTNNFRGQTEDYGVLIESPDGIISHELAVVNLYPNPNNGSFTINSSSKINSYEVYSYVGQLLDQQSGINTNTFLWSDNNLPSGQYLIVLSFEDESKVVKKFTIK
ncbi:MAG: PKD domain-containing protein [Flavobacteriales bacterium]|nr:PKD domain-containing protein [Flavobacteriales bacterium]